MKSLSFKLARETLSLRHIDIYLAMLLNFSLILAVIAEKSDFFRNIFIPTVLTMNVAILVTIIIMRFSFKEGTLKENIYIILSVILETFLLFRLPFFLSPIPDLFFLRTLMMAGVQSCATIFFFKAFRGELERLYIFLVRTGNLLPKRISPHDLDSKPVLLKKNL
jgi:hypothetical protein